MLGEKRLYAPAVDSVDFSQQSDSFRFRQRLRAAKRLVWMVIEDPAAELVPDFGLTDALNDLDIRVAQDARAGATDSWMRVVHADHNAGDTALGDGDRTRGCAAMEGTRLEGGIQGRANHTLPARLRIARRSDLGVIFSRAKSVAAPDKLALLVHDHTADPGVVAGGPAREFRLLDREAHPLLMHISHRQAAQFP